MYFRKCLKNKYRNSRNKNNKEGNMNPTKAQSNTSILECEEEEIGEMPEMEFKRIILGFLRSSEKQIH